MASLILLFGIVSVLIGLCVLASPIIVVAIVMLIAIFATIGKIDEEI